MTNSYDLAGRSLVDSVFLRFLHPFCRCKTLNRSEWLGTNAREARNGEKHGLNHVEKRRRHFSLDKAAPLPSAGPLPPSRGGSAPPFPCAPRTAFRDPAWLFGHRTCISTYLGFPFLLLPPSPPPLLGSDPRPPPTKRAAGTEEPCACPRGPGRPSGSTTGCMQTPSQGKVTRAPQTPPSALTLQDRVQGQDSARSILQASLKFSFGISKKKLGTLFKGSMKLSDTHLLPAFSGR